MNHISTSTSSPWPQHTAMRICINHLGFTCFAKKTFIVLSGEESDFEIQNMALNRPSTWETRENFQSIYEGKLKRIETAVGSYLTGDFTEVKQPGIYRVVLPESGEHSYQFSITDGAFSSLPEFFLRFVHNWRSGPFENAWRAASHLDDGVRSDTGEPMDATGGWYDAGDVRKWMVHSNLPALALMDAHDNIKWHYAEWERCEDGFTPWITEALWGLDFLLKMQDPGTGMFYEDVGGGGKGRWQPGMSWFYENHSGCYADNHENRFTDNILASGDERRVRIQFNPIVQYTTIAILARASKTLNTLDSRRSECYLRSAVRAWDYTRSPDRNLFENPEDSYELWTSVRSWKCIAALELFRNEILQWDIVETAAISLLDNFSESLGFWVNSADSNEPFRGLIQSAQPLIALAKIIAHKPDARVCQRIRLTLNTCLKNYVYPLASMTPYECVPFGVYTSPISANEVYREWRGGLFFRFFMPENHSQRINHGLGGHWTSWAHALALVGSILEEPRAIDLAWKQLYWLTGQNPYNSTLITGIGWNNPMPHSRLMGTHPGGFCIGFIGTKLDHPHLDLKADAQWNTCEYWMTPLSNALMALSALLPKDSGPDRKIGATESHVGCKVKNKHQ